MLPQQQLFYVCVLLLLLFSFKNPFSQHNTLHNFLCTYYYYNYYDIHFLCVVSHPAELYKQRDKIDNNVTVFLIIFGMV